MSAVSTIPLKHAAKGMKPFFGYAVILRSLVVVKLGGAAFATFTACALTDGDESL
jgi:hypothetical protein